MTKALGFVLSLCFLCTACGPDPRPEATPDAAAGPPEPARYALRSTFDISHSMPGEVGRVFQELFEATDDPADPTLFLLDLMIDGMADGPLKSLAKHTEPFIAAYLNEKLLGMGPELVRRVVAIGRDLGDAASSFGLNETLELAIDGRTAIHRVDGVHFELSGVAYDLAFADYGMRVADAGIDQVETGGGVMALAKHHVALPYRQVLQLAIDHAIVPHIDPGAADLVGLLSDAVDCNSVGAVMAEAMGAGQPATYAQLCRDGLTLAATSVYGEIGRLGDAELGFDIAGLAVASDRDGDGRVDTLTSGQWTGQLDQAGTPTALGTAKFRGNLLQ